MFGLAGNYESKQFKNLPSGPEKDKVAAVLDKDKDAFDTFMKTDYDKLSGPAKSALYVEAVKKGWLLDFSLIPSLPTSSPSSFSPSLTALHDLGIKFPDNSEPPVGDDPEAVEIVKQADAIYALLHQKGIFTEAQYGEAVTKVGLVHPWQVPQATALRNYMVDVAKGAGVDISSIMGAVAAAGIGGLILGGLAVWAILSLAGGKKTKAA